MADTARHGETMLDVGSPAPRTAKTGEQRAAKAGKLPPIVSEEMFPVEAAGAVPSA